MKRYRFLKVLKVIAIVAIGTALFGFVVERLWNWLMPAIFGWRAITFVQALGLLVLSKILFGGFHRHGGRHRRGWRRGMGERWAKMTPEDRERFRAGMRGKFGCSREQKPTPEQVAR